MFWVAQAGLSEKRDVLAFLSRSRGTPLDWKQAQDVAQACGLVKEWKKASSLTGRDVVSWIMEFLGAFEAPF